MTTPWLAPAPSSSPPLRPRNDVDLTRERLIAILEHFSQTLVAPFASKPLRLVVHGGACMLLHPMLFNLSSQQHQLHPTLPHRTSTRDVDYIHRSFVTEMSQLGVQNAAEKIKMCIHATAKQFVLGADWMNSDADIALPMATAPNGMSYDPIYYASVQPNNINLHTIFRSTNGMLTLISVTPFWAVSLKLVRYTPQDAADICLLLRNGTIISQVQWTVETLREWLFANCWVMGYASYDKNRLNQLNVRLEHAIKMVNEWGMNLPGPTGDASIGKVNAVQRPHASQSPPPTHLGQSQSMPNFAMPESSWSSVNMPPHQPHLNGGISALAAMGGGGEVVGGEFGRGWNPQYGHEQQRASMTSPQQYHQPNSNPSSSQNSPTSGSNEWGLAQAQRFDFSVVSQRQQQQQRAAAAAASAAKKARRKSAAASAQGDNAAGVNGHRHSNSVTSWGTARTPLQDIQQQQQLVYKHQQEAQRLHQEQMELYQKLQQQSEAPEQQLRSKSFSGMGLEAFDMGSLGRELAKADGHGSSASASTSTLPPYSSGQGISSPPPYPYTHGNYGGAGKAYPYAVPQPSLHAPVVPLGPSLSTSSNSSSLSRKHDRDKDKKTKKEREKEERDKERRKKEKREDKERKRERQWRIGEKKEVEVGKWSLKLGLGGFGSGKSDAKKMISPDANGVTLKDSEDYFQKHLEGPIHIVGHAHPGKELGVYDEDSGSSEEEDSDSEDELPPGALPFPRYAHHKDQARRYPEGNSDYTDEDSEDEEESDDDTERGGPESEGWTGRPILQTPPATPYNAPPPASAPPAFHTTSSGHATRAFPPPPPSAPPTQGLPNGGSTYPGMVASVYPPQPSSHHPHQSSVNGAVSTYPGQDLVAPYPPQSSTTTYPAGASTYPGQSTTAVTAYHPPQPGTRPNSPQRQSANLSSSFGHSASMPSIYSSNGAGANGPSAGLGGDGAPGYNLGIAPATESRSRKSSTLGVFPPPGVARSEDLVPIPPVPTPIPAAQIEYERERAEREKKREKKEKERRKKEKRREEEAEEPFIPPVVVTSDPSFRASLGHQSLDQAAHPYQQQQQQGHVGSPHSRLGAPAGHALAQAPPSVQHRQYLTQPVQESNTGHERRLSQQVYPQQGQIPPLQSSAMYQQMSYQQQKPPSSMDTRSRASISGPSYEDRQRSYSGGAQGQASSAPVQGMGMGQQHLWQSPPMHSQPYHQPQTRQSIYPQH